MTIDRGTQLSEPVMPLSSNHLESDNDPIYDFVIPLSPFEKIILDGIHSVHFTFSFDLDSTLEQSAQIGENEDTDPKLGIDDDPYMAEFEELMDDTAQSGQIHQHFIAANSPTALTQT